MEDYVFFFTSLISFLSNPLIFLSTFILPNKARDKENYSEFLLVFLGRKENILGLLIQSRIATIISWSPALTENFSRAPRIAFELTSLDASWITTTLWVSVVIVFLLQTLGLQLSNNLLDTHKKVCRNFMYKPFFVNAHSALLQTFHKYVWYLLYMKQWKSSSTKYKGLIFYIYNKDFIY